MTTYIISDNTDTDTSVTFSQPDDETIESSTPISLVGKVKSWFIGFSQIMVTKSQTNPDVPDMLNYSNLVQITGSHDYLKAVNNCTLPDSLSGRSFASKLMGHKKNTQVQCFEDIV